MQAVASLKSLVKLQSLERVLQADSLLKPEQVEALNDFPAARQLVQFILVRHPRHCPTLCGIASRSEHMGTANLQ